MVSRRYRLRSASLALRSASASSAGSMVFPVAVVGRLCCLPGDGTECPFEYLAARLVVGMSRFSLVRERVRDNVGMDEFLATEMTRPCRRARAFARDSVVCHCLDTLFGTLSRCSEKKRGEKRQETNRENELNCWNVRDAFRSLYVLREHRVPTRYQSSSTSWCSCSRRGGGSLTPRPNCTAPTTPATVPMPTSTIAGPRP